MDNEQKSSKVRLPKFKTFLFTSAVFLFFLTIAITVAEIYLKEKTTPEFPFYSVIYPYVMFRNKSGDVFFDTKPSPSSRNKGYTQFFTNEEGLRVPSIGYKLEKAKPLGELRIAVIGGSTVATGTTYEVTLPGALKRALQSKYPGRDIEVINGGIIGAIARQELVYFLLTIVDYEPDILVTYDGVNDTGIMLLYEDRPNFPYNWEVMEKAWEQYKAGFKDSWWRLLLGRSAIVQRLWPDFGWQPAPRKTIDPGTLIKDAGCRRKYINAYIENWEKIFHVCQGYKVHPVFILQPINLLGGESVEEVYRKTRKDVTIEDKLSRAKRLRINYATKLMYEDARAAVSDFAKDHPDATVHDMSTLLPTDSFYDGCHVYDEVNDTIAQEIVNVLAPVIDKMYESKASLAAQP